MPLSNITHFALLGLLTLPAQLLPAQDRTFPADAVVDVTKPPYGAIPNDGQDDTAALQRAITANVDTGRALYFPVGTYEIRDTLVAKNAQGLWRPRITLQGQNRSTTILKLADAAPGFGDAAAPSALWMSGSHWGEGDSLEGGGNKAFCNNVFDLTIDTGRDNPGAIGIEWANSNQGAIKNVTVRSGDGAGSAGIALRRRIPGPGLIKHVRVEGFAVGIDLGDMQYGITLEHVDLKGQSTAGLRVGQNLAHIRALTSEKPVTVDPAGVLTMLDSQVPSVVGAEHAHLPTRAPSPPAILAEETPEFWNSDLADWEPVGPRREDETDDTQAIQRALDSGKGTIYTPNNRVYFLSDTVVIRGRARQFLGMGAEISLGAAKEPFSDIANPRPLFRIDPTATDTVFMENVFFNAQYPGEVLIENNSPSTLVIKHCAGWVGADGHRRSYRNTPAATGKVFIEDVFLPGWEFRHQSVWARQFNPENWDGDGSSPQVLNSGGKLWILGSKTEGPAPFLETSQNATTVLLGAYNYVSATKADPLPSAIPYIISEDSHAQLTFTTENFRDHDYLTYFSRAPSSALNPRWQGVNPNSHVVTYFEHLPRR